MLMIQVDLLSNLLSILYIHHSLTYHLFIILINQPYSFIITKSNMVTSKSIVWIVCLCILVSNIQSFKFIPKNKQLIPQQKIESSLVNPTQINSDEPQNPSITHIDVITNASLSRTDGILNKSVDYFNKNRYSFSNSNIGNQNNRYQSYSKQLEGYSYPTYYTDEQDAVYYFYSLTRSTVAQDSKTYSILNTEKQSYEVNIGYVDFIASFNWKKVVLATNKTTFGYGKIIASSDSIKYNALIESQKSQAGQLVNVSVRLINSQEIKVKFNKDQIQVTSSGKTQQDIKNIAKFVLDGTWQTPSIFSMYQQDFNGILVKKIIQNIRFDSSPFASKFSYFKKVDGDNYNSYSFSITFTKKPVYLKFQQDRIVYGYQMSIDGYEKPECIDLSKNKPYQSQKYGQTQTSISYCFLEYVLKYGIQKNYIYPTYFYSSTYYSRAYYYLNNVLDIQTFHGQLSQLATLIPNLKKKQIASDSYVIVNSTIAQDSIQIVQSNSSFFSLSMKVNCMVNLSSSSSSDEPTIIQNIVIDMLIDVKGRNLNDYTDFYISKFNIKKIEFQSVGELVVQNKELGQQIVKSTLSMLFRPKTFGSGWPLTQLIPKAKYQSLQKQILIYGQNQN